MRPLVGDDGQLGAPLAAAKAYIAGFPLLRQLEMAPEAESLVEPGGLLDATRVHDREATISH
jgi:hypothetical protein